MTRIKGVLLFISSMSLMVLFQNCGDVDFHSSNPNFKSSSQLDTTKLDGDENREDDRNNDGGSRAELPFDRDLNVALENNSACTDHFAAIDVSQFSAQASQMIAGITGDIVTANVDNLKIAGISKSIAARNIGVAKVSGIHGSVCIQAAQIDHISGIIAGEAGHIAIFGPDNQLGYAHHLSGIAGSDMVIVDYEVDQITGIGRSLHIFGGRVNKIAGIFNEVHLYEGAEVGNLRGLNAGVIVH